MQILDRGQDLTLRACWVQLDRDLVGHLRKHRLARSRDGALPGRCFYDEARPLLLHARVALRARARACFLVELPSPGCNGCNGCNVLPR